LENVDFMELFYILVGVALIITVVIFFMEREKKLPRGRKKENANAAVTVLKRFAANNSCKVLGPVTLTKGDRTARLDAVLVGWFGVLGIKSYGYNGQVYGNAGEDEWVWVSADKREKFENPIGECTLAARLMREALMNAGVRNPESEAVYVFTDSKLEMCIPRALNPMNLSDLRSYLRKDKFLKDRGYDLDTMVAALEPFVNK
jgi:hypothetical protein